MNNKRNIVKYIKMFSIMLFVLVVAMVINKIAIATTNPTAPAVGTTVQLSRVAYPGGEEATGFFDRGNAERKSTQQRYDTRGKHAYITGENLTIRRISKGGSGQDIL